MKLRAEARAKNLETYCLHELQRLNDLFLTQHILS